MSGLLGGLLAIVAILMFIIFGVPLMAHVMTWWVQKLEKMFK